MPTTPAMTPETPDYFRDRELRRTTRPSGYATPELHVQHLAIGVQHGFLHGLRDSRMREDGVEQFFFRRLEIHRHHKALDQFGDFGADQMRAEQLPGLLVEDHLAQALVLAHGDGFAVGGEREATDAD